MDETPLTSAPAKTTVSGLGETQMALAEVIRHDVAPAPWRLEGSAYALLFKLPRLVNAERLSRDAAERFVGGTSVLLLADYAGSPAGPHRELLYIPGRFHDGRSSYYSVSRGFASSPASVDGGWANWGVPKELADFTVERHGRAVDVSVAQGDRVVASFSIKAGRFGISTSTDLVPSAKRTLFQMLRGRGFYIAPEGRGTVKRATLAGIDVAERAFPDLRQFSPKAVVKVEGFSIALPRPTVEPLVESTRLQGLIAAHA